MLLLAACSQGGDSPDPAMPGSDRDEHGCIPSAGYQWCAKTAQCERPWELAESAGFEDNPEQFDAYCSDG